MAALKVQSLNDIITAYFKSLGFKEEGLEKAVQAMVVKYQNRLDEKDVIASLDAILVSHLKLNFEDDKLDDTQKAAMFKLVFLEQDGASKWGAEAFVSEKWPRSMVDCLKNSAIVIAPGYKISHMEAQKIEAAHPIKAVRKILNIFNKG